MSLQKLIKKIARIFSLFGIDTQPGVDVVPQQPGPDSALMISGISGALPNAALENTQRNIRDKSNTTLDIFEKAHAEDISSTEEASV